jgi:predicted dehydrogenase
MSEDLSVGIAGYGLAGSVFHAPLVAATPGLRVAAIVTGNAERAAQAARDHPGASVVGSVEEMLAAGVDVVVVATPNRHHVPVALAALEAGAAVVVDKPMAATARDARRLADEARRRNLVLAVFHNRRWDGDFLTVRRLRDEGRLGEVVRFESRFERWRPEVDAARWREQADPADAGGLLFDLGSHLVDQAIELLGPPASVYAEVAARRPGAQVDDDVFVALEHPGGVRSHLWASAVAGAPGPRFRVLGLGAAYVKAGLDPQEAALRAGGRPGDPDWGRDELDGRLVAGDAEEAVPTERGAYEAFYASLVAAVRDGAPPPVSAEDGVRVVEILEAARRSASQRDVVVI